MKNFSFLFFFILLFAGCSVKYNDVNLNNPDYKDENVKHLSNDILSLSNTIDKNEAKNVAYEAIEYSKYLANKYELVSPPLFHNFLVNTNFRDKGLCYHFARDLQAYLQSKNYKTFKFYRIVANKQEYDEHNAVLLNVDGASLKDGIILDAWRNSGELFWSKVKDDKDYEWKLKIIK